jgi:hypothetical protein
MAEFKPKTYQSDYYHNEHGNDRDKFLIEEFGEEWLKDMKAKGYFGGDWSEDIVGTKKVGNTKSGYIKDGEVVALGEEIFLDASSS